MPNDLNLSVSPASGNP